MGQSKTATRSGASAQMGRKRKHTPAGGVGGVFAVGYTYSRGVSALWHGLVVLWDLEIYHYHLVSCCPPLRYHPQNSTRFFRHADESIATRYHCR